MRHFQKIFVLLLAEHSDEHMKHLYLGHSFTFFFPSVMTIACEHSPFLVACVPPETKDRNPRTPSLFGPQASFREILHHLHFAIMWLVCSTKCKQTTNTKGKECGLVVSSRFFWGKRCVDPKKRLWRLCSSVTLLAKWWPLRCFQLQSVCEEDLDKVFNE